MELKNFTNNLAKEDGIRSHLHFETFVYKLLEKHLHNQSKKINLYDNPNSPFDFYMPDGINQFNSPIGVIVKFVKRNRNSYFAAMRRFFEKEILPSSIKRIIIIFSDEIKSEVKDELQHYILQKTGLEADIWDLDDLSKIAENYKDYLTEIVDDFEKVFINTVVSKSLGMKQNTLVQKKEENIKQLKEAYKNDDLVLFLGAGVSKDAEIPAWNVLVTDLLVSMISEKLKENNIEISQDEQIQIINNIKERIDSSPLLQARYIRTGLGSKFPEVVTKILYKNIKSKNGTSNLLKSITRLCTPNRSSLGTRAVVTYNFDDLLENHLKERNIPCVSIFRDMDTFTKDELPIYHVHGYLPREKNDYDENSDNLLVFSEEGYHALIIDPYCWSNITQLNFLRENTCLMVGLSLTDPNLRRLLDIAARKIHQPRHFAILKRQNIKDKFNKAISSKAIDSFIAVDQELQEESYRELGISILWVDDYHEIPNIIDSIRN